MKRTTDSIDPKIEEALKELETLIPEVLPMIQSYWATKAKKKKKPYYNKEERIKVLKEHIAFLEWQVAFERDLRQWWQKMYERLNSET